MAKAKGFDFTEEDLLNYEKEMLEKLSEEELMNISGGVSLMNKKALSLFLASVSLAGNIQSTQAVVRRDVIMKSVGKIVGEESVGQNQQEGIGEETRQQEAKPEMSGEQVRRAQLQQLESMETEEQKEEEEHKEEVDVQYILDALNLVDPYVFNLSGTTENFRFFDGYKQKISTQAIIAAADGIPSWDYNKDEGAGSPNFMRCLFPSSAGRLNVAGGASDLEKFSRDCKPTPELVARIIGYIHNHIRNENEAAAKDLNGLMENFEQDNAEQFLKEYLNVSVDCVQQEDKEVYIKTILYLLKNAEIMIKEQESDGQDPEKILPKYMPERMFMSYFILNFSEEEEVNAFYTEAKRVIRTKSDIDQSEIDRSKERLGKVTELLGKIRQNEGSPYKEKLQQNASAKLVKKGDKSGEARFSDETFQDCADIAVRHIINLLSYNEKDRWKFIVDEEGEEEEEEEESLGQGVEEILNGMRNRKEFIFKSLKERVELFFYYQANHPQGADAVDPETRSLWNYVISNMDKNNKEEGMYELQYNRRGNELKPGYLNMLKAIYNIVYALKRGDAEVNTKFEGVGKSIENLEKAIKANKTGDDLKGALCTAIEDTFSLIRVVRKIEVRGNVNIHGTDCFCTVGVNDFVISQKEGHASVAFNPLLIENFKKDDPLKEFLMEDSTAQLLSHVFYRFAFTPKLPVFNFLFCSDGCWWYSYDITFFKNFKALRFLKGVQGEGGNTSRIDSLINEYCGESNIKIFDEPGAKVISLTMFVFRNYVTTREQFQRLIPNGTLNEMFKDYQGDEIYEKDGVRFYFKVNADERVTIYPLVGDDIKDLKIPSSISVKGKNHKVSRIGAYSFIDNRTLETVTIEDGIEDLTIEKMVFKGSNSIKELTVQGSVKNLNIEEGAFEGSSIQEFKVLGGDVQKLSIGGSAFKNTRLFREFNLPNGVKEVSIGWNAFSKSKIKRFIVPVNAESLNIGNFAFEDTESLEEFSISDNVRELLIGTRAFSMSRIKNFEVPKSVEKLTIGAKAFKDTKSLNEFNMSGNIKNLDIGMEAFIESRLKKFIVPESIECVNIGGYAFGNTKLLGEFNIYVNRILDIGMGAFSGSNLKKFIVSGNIGNLNIGTSAFANTDKLEEFSMPDNVSELAIRDKAFLKSSIKNFEVLESVEKLIIGAGAFKETESLEEFNISANIKNLDIGMEAFIESNLEKFVVPESVESLNIGKSAFADTAELEEFSMPDNVSELVIRDNAFLKSSIKNFEVLKSVEKLIIGVRAFKGTELLNEFNISANMKNIDIGMEAFIKSNLKKFIVSGDVESLNIGKSAFAGTAKLEEFSMPDNVSELAIQDNAFLKSSIKNFEVPKSVEKLIIGWQAFAGTESLKEFNIFSGVKDLDFGSMIFEKSGVKEIVVPEGVENLAISGYLFDTTRSSIDFNIPPTVKELKLKDGAFTGSHIEKFQVPDSVKTLTIGWESFKNTKLFKEFNVSASVEELRFGNKAFMGSSIKEFKIEQPSNLKTLIMGDDAFADTELLAFSIPDSIKELSIDKEIFERSSVGILRVPNNIEKLTIRCGLFRGQQTTMNFNMPDNVRELVIDMRMMNGSNIKEFKLPTHVKKLTIKDQAFANTKYLKEFYVPDSVEELEIEGNAFEGSNIEKFEIRGNLRRIKIEKSAFAWTSSLREFILPARAEVEAEVEGDPFEGSSIDESNIPDVIREKIE